ncbi:MAG: non-heme iron oxygenase ferredoxin subunit [Actinomycetes bacterium]
MTFRPVISDVELADGAPKQVIVDGVPVCLVRTEGQLFAIGDVCSHGQVSLAEGEVDGTAIECWLHGSRFDLRTGRPLSLPATEAVAVHAVKIEDGTVLVDVEESLA